MKTAEIYASSLYALAEDMRITDQIAEEIEILHACMSEQSKYPLLLDSGNIPMAEKAKLIDAAFGVFHPCIVNMLKVMAEYKHASSFTLCAEKYLRLYEKNRGIIRAKITLPAEIGAEELERLKSGIRAKSGKNVLIEVSIDPKLIGGMKLQISGREYDNSIRSKLADLRERISGKAAED